jgi:hypothetical protein
MRLRLILPPLILLMSCWPCSQFSSASLQKSGFAELEKIALEELQETGTPGAAVAVISGEQVVFAKGFGESNVEAHAPIKPEMLFRLGAPTRCLPPPRWRCSPKKGGRICQWQAPPAPNRAESSRLRAVYDRSKVEF